MKFSKKLENILFHSKSVHIRDRTEVYRKLENLISDGHEKFQIVTDFDYTLTRYYMSDDSRGSTARESRSWSTFGVLENSQTLGAEYRAKNIALYNEYHPHELNEALPLDVRRKYMEEWWDKSHKVLMESGLRFHDLETAVEETQNNVAFRSGIESFFDEARRLAVPVLVFSAGMTDIVTELLKCHLSVTQSSYPHLRVISNQMKWSASDGTFLGFEEPVIHVLNKGAVAVEHIEDRPNVLLMGDHLGDLHMSDGMKFANQLSIGFLNVNVEERFGVYLDRFDVVITDDGPLDVVLAVLEEVETVEGLRS